MHITFFGKPGFAGRSPVARAPRREARLAQSDLRRAAQAEQLAQSSSDRTTCAEQLAQSGSGRAACAEQFAQSNLGRATRAERLGQSNLRRAACAAKLAPRDSRKATRAERRAVGNASLPRLPRTCESERRARRQAGRGSNRCKAGARPATASEYESGLALGRETRPAAPPRVENRLLIAGTGPFFFSTRGCAGE